MATIKQVLDTYVRTELEDKAVSRWSDDQLLVFFKQAVQRTNAIGTQRRLEFMKGKEDVTVAAGDTSFSLPTDFFTPISLVNTGTKQELQQKTGHEMDKVISTSAMSLYQIEDSVINLKDASTSDTDLRLRYFIKVDAAKLTLSAQSPWGSRLDVLLAEYVSFRARKVDRYDTSIDTAALKDLEDNILFTYSNVNSSLIKSKGWL